MNKNFVVTVAKIVEVDPGETLKYCVICDEPTRMGVQLAGPLFGWHQCARCKAYYNPGVIFEGENDDSCISEVKK